MNNIAVIGGGAAGLMAAYFAAENSHVTLYERNEKLGKKIYITGKGRCNITNNCDEKDFLSHINSNPKFLYGCLHSFTPTDAISFFEDNGLKLKTERGNRVFPLSDKASDVTKCLERLINSRGVRIKLNDRVLGIERQGADFCVHSQSGDDVYNSVIVCTGGLSYPSTGSTGDGYEFACNAGHDVIPPKPALVGIELVGEDFKCMQGLSLKNVSVAIFRSNKRIFEAFGEMLFTHFGVSGPVILSASSAINRENVSSLTLKIDFKPALSEETLDARILRDFSTAKNKDISNALTELLPRAAILPIIEQSNISPYKKVNAITVQERKRLIQSIKGMTYNVKSLRPIEEGIVTAGGVNIKQINPSTMESKLVSGLYFAGEVLDVDADTGGYNLHTAFATGRAAGIAASMEKTRI